jgi:hypothetical protein
MKMVDKFPGEEKVYRNFESIEDDSCRTITLARFQSNMTGS